MEYVVSLRTALNDIKALSNLEPHRKLKVLPLMRARGKDDKQVTSFLECWGNYPFLLDVSRFFPDKQDQLIVNQSLHASDNGFEARRGFYAWAAGLNRKLIPVVSWESGDPTREIVQFAVILHQQYESTAVVVDMNSGLTEIEKVTRILDAVADPRKLIIVLDFGERSPPNLTSSGELILTMQKLHTYGINQVVLLSTAFPQDKPPSGSTRVVTCVDLVWQNASKKLVDGVKFIYGDYGATSPNSPLDYIPGMPVIPFANVLIDSEWHQIRDGKDKEFFVYPDIAMKVRLLPNYQGDEFCWATREIARIASKVDGKYGNNGTWNGFKTNHHICAVLDEIGPGGRKVGGSGDEDEI